jgi:hypothetical protein
MTVTPAQSRTMDLEFEVFIANSPLCLYRKKTIHIIARRCASAYHLPAETAFRKVKNNESPMRVMIAEMNRHPAGAI